MRGGYCDSDCMSPSTIQRFFKERRLSNDLRLEPLGVATRAGGHGEDGSKFHMFDVQPSYIASSLVSATYLNPADAILAAAVVGAKDGSKYVGHQVVVALRAQGFSRRSLASNNDARPPLRPNPLHHISAMKATTSAIFFCGSLNGFTQKVPVLSLQELGDTQRWSVAHSCPASNRQRSPLK